MNMNEWVIMWYKWSNVTLCPMNVKHVDFMFKIHEVYWFMCNIYQDYVNHECDVLSLSEFLRSTRVGVVVLDTISIVHDL